MTGNSKSGNPGLLGGFGRCVLFAAVTVVLLSAGQDARAQATAEQEICGLIKTYCKKVNGVRINDAVCKSAKKQKRTYKYACGKKRKQKTAGPQVCRGFVERGRGAIVSLSTDARNPRVFGYCVKGTAHEARQCAYQACIERGGRSCHLPCNTKTGKEIRACNADTVTIVMSSDYARLGCGARHVRRGIHTFDTYIERELKRCLEQSKSPGSCKLEAAWR